MGPSKSNAAGRFLLIVGSVIFILALIELPALTGILDYRTLIGPHHGWWVPNVSDPELIHAHRPYAHQTGASRGGEAAFYYDIPTSDMTSFHWDVKYDRRGFRNKTDLRSADIAVLGDSFVEGLVVADAELTTSHLAHLQGKVVANLGQAVWGPLEELVVLKRYALPLKPRTVVWVFFEGNDLGDVIAYRRAMRNPPSFAREFWARSFTRGAVKEVEHLFHPPVKLPGVKRSGVLHSPEGETRTVYFMYPSQPFTAENLGALDEPTRALAEAHTLCAAQGAQLLAHVCHCDL